ncbi:EBDP4, emopamil-binding protein [Podospora aff. communis PSN243]|uniref:EBDP4, emopamil-binding protein n=1 Tax=Podospora aff. communis PSN243 TaxID=3040156 RepID=A0AAV9GRT6_9PEZI|nr:EBDP4, emopamil-binding protein [Podospora aff. communis PSN243]
MWPFSTETAPVESATPPSHPYYPVGVHIKDYAANEFSVPVLLAYFGSGCAGIFALSYVLVARVRPTLPISEVLTIFWFMLCSGIHFLFEGYFATHFDRMGGLQTLFGQLWKEYSLSDSRYLTMDPFVVCMETITAAFWGPLSALLVYLILTEHPLRHPLQIIVSLGQLYGDVLYYATSLFDDYLLGNIYSRPEPYYYYGYFVFMNAFWIVIPSCEQMPLALELY